MNLAFRHPTSQLRCVWAQACAASRRLNVTWSLDTDNLAITCGDVTLSASHRCHVMLLIRQVLTADIDRALHGRANQEKVMTCVVAHQASSHFLRLGAYTHFADWRFVYFVRLNLLSLDVSNM
ncbi:hypothetical protein HPB51_001322 [Rhipicephalus microplus]|uniref:Uncharacterized protein n=1 Tax=Rhipicephalus microplus TaxID=6941 RepID=A0A9J6DXR6_RHIMP|nr:hypothetical protein HPB51_001322 [Rhipicephalus microplus]